MVAGAVIYVAELFEQAVADGGDRHRHYRLADCRGEAAVRLA
jgi:hypothetical protein